MSNFYDVLKQRESGGADDPQRVENGLHYIGFYQMGEAALIDAGYYKADGTKKNDWTGQWTGKNGIYSKEDFLNNAAVQEIAVREYHEKLWGYIQAKLKDTKNNKDVNSYLNTTINGDVITKEALIGGAHLVGAGGLVSYITSNGKVVPGDGNNVKVSSYIKLLKNTTISSDSFNNNAPAPTNLSSVFRVDNSKEVFDFEKNIFDYWKSDLVSDNFYSNISKIVSSYLISNDPTSNFASFQDYNYFSPIDIGAFYEANTSLVDNSVSIANKTYSILNSSNQAISKSTLESLDLNKDGKLYGNEISSLNAWKDLNEDGIAQSDEIVSFSSVSSVLNSFDYDLHTTNTNQRYVTVTLQNQSEISKLNSSFKIAS